MVTHSSSHRSRPSPIVLAVRDRYERIHREIQTLAQEAERARQAAEDARNRLQMAKAELEELGNFLVAQSDTADQAAAIQRKVEEQTGQVTVRRAVAMDIVTRVELLLNHYAPLRTTEILQRLLEQGVEFHAANPAQRLSQILSESDKFLSDRTRGWALKNPSMGFKKNADIGLQERLTAVRRVISARAAVEPQLPFNANPEDSQSAPKPQGDGDQR